MRLFVDTSAIQAILDADDLWHPAADAVWQRVVLEDATLITTNYIVTEFCALVQRRRGLEAIDTFHRSIRPLLTIHWIDESIHDAAMLELLLVRRRQVSLVDCTSFETMRRLLIQHAFAFDPHFAEQGFSLVPEQAE